MNIGFRILPSPPPPPPGLVEALRGRATSHLSDCMGRVVGSGAGLRPMHAGGAMAGPALTVKVPPGDNLMVHKALDLARAGDVIVVDAGGETTNAIIGEIMSRLAAKRGLGGLVIDGAIRDVAAIAAGALPVYARGVSHRGPYKDGPGEINVPVSIGGMVVRPGDLVVGDADGLVVLAAQDAPAVLEAAIALAAREDVTMRGIDDGTVDRSWVDATLRQKGLAV